MKPLDLKIILDAFRQIRQLSTGSEKDRVVFANQPLQMLVQGMCFQLELAGLRNTAKWSQKLFEKFKSASITIAQLEATLEEGLDRLFDELPDVRIYAVDPSDITYHDQRPPRFGWEAPSVFPEAADDMRAAGMCLAFGQDTACVFHVMRVLESAVLKRLCVLLGVPEHRTWGHLLIAIEKATNSLKGVDPRRRALLNELSADLRAIKNAWRDPTMHVTHSYNHDDAKHILDVSSVLTQKIIQLLKDSAAP
jgi:hypothetical protein